MRPDGFVSGIAPERFVVVLELLSVKGDLVYIAFYIPFEDRFFFRQGKAVEVLSAASSFRRREVYNFDHFLSFRKPVAGLNYKAPSPESQSEISTPPKYLLANRAPVR